jgi:hypothetical protein
MIKSRAVTRFEQTALISLALIFFEAGRLALHTYNTG